MCTKNRPSSHRSSGRSPTAFPKPWPQLYLKQRVLDVQIFSQGDVWCILKMTEGLCDKSANSKHFSGHASPLTLLLTWQSHRPLCLDHTTPNPLPTTSSSPFQLPHTYILTFYQINARCQPRSKEVPSPSVCSKPVCCAHSM